MADSIYARHLRERPLKGLTQDELRALVRIGKLAPVLVDELGTAIAGLAELAHSEIEEQWLAESVASPRNQDDRQENPHG